MVIFVDETACRSCGTADLEPVVEFGSTPLADRLLRADQLDEEELSAPLTLVVCRTCALAQIRETVDPEILFFEEYPYYSSVSPSLMEHFASSARSIIEQQGLDSDSLVIEAASNDGYMLRHFAELGARVLGVDPAVGPAQTANDRGIPTLIEFFGRDLAARLRDQYGPADVFLANNVLAHVPDLNGFVKGIATVLADDGVAVIEAPYAVDLVEHCEFDTIYHQHLCYFAVTALVPLFERHGLHLNDVERISIHGGSLRLFVGRRPARHPVVDEMLAEEADRGFDGPTAYRQFARRITRLRDELREMLDGLKQDGLRLAGYGAAAKATTLMSFCRIGADDLDYVCDLNEYKHGRFMGGNHLPIVAPTHLQEDPPEAVVILAWNFADEIMSQNSWFEERGGKFLVPVPEPRVVE